MYLNMGFLQLILHFFLLAPNAESPAQENGEEGLEAKVAPEPGSPKKCDIILISGRKERCDGANEALKVSEHCF